MAPATPSVSGVIREILVTDLELPTVDVLHRAKARGVTASDKSIRDSVHNLRSQLRKAAAGGGNSAPAPVSAPADPSVAAPFPEPATPPSMSGVIRTILADDLDLPAGRVIERARTRGLTAPVDRLRNLTANLRSKLKQAAKSAPAAEPATAPRTTVSASEAVPALSAVLGSITMVNAVVGSVVGSSGGPAAARRVAEAVRACGGVDGFLQHLDLVATIRGESGR